MLRLAILTSNAAAAAAISEMAEQSPIFRVVAVECPLPGVQAVRSLATAAPEVVLIETTSPDALEVARQVIKARRCVLVGFNPDWTPEAQGAFEETGMRDFLSDPFSDADLEAAAFQAVHRGIPAHQRNLVAFLPAKAGSGCSTVALNTAAAMSDALRKRTLLIENDRRSGVLSILLKAEGALPRVLLGAESLTALEWRQHVVEINKLDLLLANPSDPGPLPSWVDYFHLLQFVESQYDHIVADLPELINPATAEVVNAARSVFIVCEPEIASLRLAGLRRAELERCDVPLEKIRLVVNRWEPRRMTEEQAVELANCPVFAWLPNDYPSVKEAHIEGSLARRDSAFGKACLDLARRLAGLPPPQQETSALSRLRRLGRNF